MAILVDTAASMFHNKNKAKETRYIVRRPRVSENDDHQRGNIDMLSI